MKPARLKTYHYRTRKSVLFLLLCSLSLAPMLLTPPGQNSSDSPIPTYWYYLPTTVVLLAACLTFLSMKVQCGEGGIRQRSLWGKKYLPWLEIVKLESNDYCLIVTAHKGTLRIFRNLADYEGLKAEIQQRTKLDVVVENTRG
jgi:hypothetical protein